MSLAALSMSISMLEAANPELAGMRDFFGPNRKRSEIEQLAYDIRKGWRKSIFFRCFGQGADRKLIRSLSDDGKPSRYHKRYGSNARRLERYGVVTTQDGWKTLSLTHRGRMLHWAMEPDEFMALLTFLKLCDAEGIEFERKEV